MRYGRGGQITTRSGHVSKTTAHVLPRGFPARSLLLVHWKWHRLFLDARGALLQPGLSCCTWSLCRHQPRESPTSAVPLQAIQMTLRQRTTSTRRNLGDRYYSVSRVLICEGIREWRGGPHISPFFISLCVLTTEPMPPSDFASANVDDIVAQLTTDEAILLTAGVGFWHTHEIPRLGIPAIKVSVSDSLY